MTHRLDTTDTCDKVIVLKDGVVAEEGTPTELLSLSNNDDGGLYYNMRMKKEQ